MPLAHTRRGLLTPPLPQVTPALLAHNNLVRATGEARRLTSITRECLATFAERARNPIKSARARYCIRNPLREINVALYSIIRPHLLRVELIRVYYRR